MSSCGHHDSSASIRLSGAQIRLSSAPESAVERIQKARGRHPAAPAPPSAGRREDSARCQRPLRRHPRFPRSWRSRALAGRCSPPGAAAADAESSAALTSFPAHPAFGRRAAFASHPHFRRLRGAGFAAAECNSGRRGSAVAAGAARGSRPQRRAQSGMQHRVPQGDEPQAPAAQGGGAQRRAPAANSGPGEAARDDPTSCWRRLSSVLRRPCAPHRQNPFYTSSRPQVLAL